MERINTESTAAALFSEQIPYTSVSIKNGFWKHLQDIARTVTVHSVYEQFEKTGRFRALSCGWKPGEPDQPHYFWDSDVAKWIEAAAYLIGTGDEPELERKADEMIGRIAAAQREDGYYNSYYLTCEPEGIFRYRWTHELYCAGHLIEAAIAYDRATGKHQFLQCMIRYADLIRKVFYEKKDAAFVTPGHEELELALLKLADYTGDVRYRELALYFIDRRAKQPEQTAHEGVPETDPAYATHPRGAEFSQSETPVRETREAVGHCVRACYLYTAMARAAAETGDIQLAEVCRDLYQDITERKMSITGGIGGYIYTEGFSDPYDLPNETDYNETCAAIALAMFAEQMASMEENSRYADLIERILYNGMLSGMSMSGDAFFYENALEIDLRAYRRTRGLTPPRAEERGLLNERRLQRAKVFTCSCCPPNILRTIASAGRFLYRQKGRTVYCEQFASSEAEFSMDGTTGKLTQSTDYPLTGKISFFWQGPPAELAVRIPGWCTEYDGEKESAEVRNGYACFRMEDGQTLCVEFPMAVHFSEADPRVRQNCGRAAVSRGPVVYCMEGIDNGPDLRDIELVPESVRTVHKEPFLLPVLEFRAFRRVWEGGLYRSGESRKEEFTAAMIPYYTYANRGESSMLVWTQRRNSTGPLSEL